MRADLILLILAGAAAVALLATGAADAALDHDQFCKAMIESARVGNRDVGRWVDRNTRDDGVEVLCDIRTVNFKRFVKAGSDALTPAWKQQKEQEWSSIACSSSVLREAIDGGWIIASVVAVTGGQRVVVIATCK